MQLKPIASKLSRKEYYPNVPKFSMGGDFNFNCEMLIEAYVKPQALQVSMKVKVLIYVDLQPGANRGSDEHLKNLRADSVRIEHLLRSLFLVVRM